VTPENVFSVLSNLALLGWIVLVAGVALRRPLLYEQVAGRFFPLALGVAYVVLIAWSFGSAEGNFNSLGGVKSLFQSDWVLVAGWVHYLAFDLFVGAWIARQTLKNGFPRYILVVILPLTLMFGPVGFVTFEIARRVIPVIAARRQPSLTGDKSL
jgi:hypothetical protein